MNRYTAGVVLAAAVVLAGCSSGDDTATTSTQTPTTFTPAPTTTTAAPLWEPAGIGTPETLHCQGQTCDITFAVTNLAPSDCGVTEGKKVVAVTIDAQPADTFTEIQSSMAFDYELWAGVDPTGYSTRSDSVRPCDGEPENVVPLNEGSNVRGTIYLSVPAESTVLRLRNGYTIKGGYEWQIPG